MNGATNGEGTGALPAETDVVVVGGGITGASAAYHLAKTGARVALLERFELNTEASGRNSGSLHGQIQHPPFLERGEGWARSFLPALEFLVDSVAMWSELGAELGTELEVTNNGGLLVAETAAQMRDIERKVRVERNAGFGAEVIGREDLSRLAPYVSSAMVGAEYTPHEGTVNPLLGAPALARSAQALGATVHTHVDVRGIDRATAGLTVTTSRTTVRCRRLVIAAGSGVAPLASLAGVRLPVELAAVQLSVTEPLERFVEHLVYYAGGALTFKQAKAGSLLIGGGWPADLDPTTGQVRVSLDSLRGNLGVAQRVVPGIGRALLLRSWAGVVRETPDLMPFIGPLDNRSDVIVGLFPHMGMTAGPLLGKTLAALALGENPERDLAPFSPDRF